MTAEADFANPYVETLPDNGKPVVRVTFTGVSGEARGLSYTVAGFWDGGRTWKARFAPPAPGEWSYSGISSRSGLRRREGQLPMHGLDGAPRKAANPTRHGFVARRQAAAPAPADTSSMRTARRSSGSAIPGGLGRRAASPSRAPSRSSTTASARGLHPRPDDVRSQQASTAGGQDLRARPISRPSTTPSAKSPTPTAKGSRSGSCLVERRNLDKMRAPRRCAAGAATWSSAWPPTT